MEPADLLRLIWQNEFGAVHTVKSEEAERAKIEAELAACAYEEDEPLYENIGNGYVRLNFRGIEPGTYSADEILADLTEGIQNASGSGEGFLKKLYWVFAHTDEFNFPFDDNKLEEAVKRYLGHCGLRGYRPIAHSESYMEQEKPLYRVLPEEKMRDFGALSRKKVSKAGHVIIIIGLILVIAGIFAAIIFTK